MLINNICIIALIIASYTDIKTREVPDWLNYTLIGLGVGINTIYSVILMNSFLRFLSLIIDIIDQL